MDWTFAVPMGCSRWPDPSPFALDCTEAAPDSATTATLVEIMLPTMRTTIAVATNGVYTRMRATAWRPGREAGRSGEW